MRQNSINTFVFFLLMCNCCTLQLLLIDFFGFRSMLAKKTFEISLKVMNRLTETANSSLPSL